MQDLAPLESIGKMKNHLPKNAKLLDLGCGSGRDAKILSEMGIDVTGIDFCSSFIEIAKRKAPIAKFQLMDMEDLSFSDSFFDGVWAAMSLGHLPKKTLPSVLQKIYSTLKKDGTFYLTFPKGSKETFESDTRYEGNCVKFQAFYEIEEIEKILNSLHFKILESAVVEKKHPYQAHAAIRIFCKKE